MATVESISSPAEMDALLASTRYVVIDFWAEWCGPCKAISPLFTKLAAANTTAGALAFARVNVDEQPELAARFGITAMPTFVFAGPAGKTDGVPLPSQVAGGGVVRVGDRVTVIRGADPKNLVVAANELGRIAKEELGGGNAAS